MELEKQTDQNLVTQNLLHGKQYCISIKKKLLKQCQKEVIYEYILAFAGWLSIFWEVVGGGGYILAGGWWSWIYIGWRWVLMDGGEWWCVVEGGGIV